MRRLIGSLALVIAIAGCKNQSGTLTNPFTLAPDRVPPPQTRVLAPGTAQPYYAGDPAPGGMPAVGTAGAPATSLPQSTLPQTSPPGGWYGPQSSGTPTGMTPTSGFNGDAVSVPVDQQQLRFASAQQAYAVDAPGGPAAPSSPSGASLNSLAGAPAMRMPIQSMLPLGGEQFSQGPVAPSRVTAREVTAAEYYAPNAFGSGVSQASATVAADGFRPQGSQPRTETEPDSPFRTPEIRRDAAEAAAEASHYGTSDNFQSLRGQLEYWPESGAWSLRYLPTDGSADSLGGRVKIDNPQVLANLQPGELVTVRGQLLSVPNEAGVAVPTYRVSGVQRQRY